MPNYESLVLYGDDLGEEGVRAATQRTREILEGVGATIAEVDEWGQRELAHLVEGHRRGHYVLFHYDLDPAAVRELDRQLKLQEGLLRFGVVKKVKRKTLPPRKPRQPPPSEDSRPADD